MNGTLRDYCHNRGHKFCPFGYAPRMTARGIAFFDIDGTLVPSGSSSSFLAARLGHQSKLDRAEECYARGELTNQQVSEIDAVGWRGVSTSTVDQWLESLPLIEGVDTVVSWCQQHGIEPVLASLAWQPVSTWIAQRYGFTANGGPRVGVSDSAFTGIVAEHFDEYDKRDRALQFAAERGVSAAKCCAIGDSRSDIPLFQSLPSSLALNAGAAAKEVATATVVTQNLTDILSWLREWERVL
jgi:phosphoserine phosphatase